MFFLKILVIPQKHMTISIFVSYIFMNLQSLSFPSYSLLSLTSQLLQQQMSTQFYRFAISLSEKLQCEAQCFTKIHKSIRKYRKIFLSNVYLYVLSQEKVKYKIAVLKIRKIIISLNSSEFVLITEAKSILIDDLTLRERMKKDIMNINPELEVAYVKETLLDEYVEGSREDQREEATVLNLVRLRGQYQQFGSKKKQRHFYQTYSSVDLVDRGEDWLLITAQKISEAKTQKKTFSSIFKREKKQIFTIKIYQKKQINKNKSLLSKILKQRKFLQQILSPYTPILHKCMHSQSAIYCITQPYRGTRLKSYLENQTLTKTQFKSLVSQIVMALGQVHQCNVVYNGITVDGLFMLDEGYIILNDFSRSCEVNTEGSQIGVGGEGGVKGMVPPQAFGEGEGKQVTGCWDWWNLGHLIFFIKEGKRWNNETMPWEKEPQLCTLTSALLETVPEKRLGFRNDYHEVLGHPYFKNINKKQLATRACEPLKKFFTPNPEKINYASDGEDWSQNDTYLTDYQFNRELQ